MYKLRMNNNNPLLFQHLKAKIIINGKNSKTYKFNDVSIAPNSTFNFYLPTKDLDAKLNDISIYLNNKSIQFNDKNDNFNFIWLILIIIFILLFIIIAIKRGLKHDDKKI